MSQRRLATIASLALSACLLPHPLPAADTAVQRILDMNLAQLQEVVVTDTKVGQAQETVTQKVEVIAASDIERHTTLNRNLSELLTYRSGLFVNTLSRNDANWGSFGGLGPKYNGYLLDGLPIDPFVDAMSLSPWIFERIELYKGPASIMYSNYLSMDFAGNLTPLAGITNFVLKDSIAAPLTRVQLGGGSYGTGGGKLYHQDTHGDLSYFVGANYEQSDYTNYGSSGSWLNISSDPDYQKGSLYAKMACLLGREDHKLSLFVHKTEHSGDVGRLLRDFGHAYDTINLAYSNQMSARLNLQLKGGYRAYDRHSGEGEAAVPDHSGVEQRIWPVDLSLNIKHAGESLLTVGLDAQFADYLTYAETNGLASTNNRVSSLSRGVFVQEKLILDQWTLRAGGRFNDTRHHYETINGASPAGGAADKSWRQPLWSVGARFNAASSLALYTNLGSSFVVPSAKQIWGTTTGQLPNPGLSEESGIGSDLGLEWRPLAQLGIGLRGFMNQLDDAIIDNVVSLAPSRTQSVNAGNARSFGGELMADYSVHDDLQCFANLTYTASEVENALDQDNDGTNIPFVPDLMVNAGLTARLPWEVTITPYLHLVGSYYDSTSRSGRHQFGSYQTVNIKIHKAIPSSAGHSLSAFIDLNNITDQRFEMPWGFSDPGFNAFIGLEATIF